MKRPHKRSSRPRASFGKRGRSIQKNPRSRSILPQPRLSPRLEKVFRQIGMPAKAPFQPDPFQLEALGALESGDVLVIAPTGSGKTWIAQEAIRGYLAQNKRSWYASPLKALSNSKFTEFSRTFGLTRVGILTGDRKEQPDAPLVIGTTEILRNQLYDAMAGGRDIAVDLAILDEAHYLGDPARGVVWEEVLVYIPQRVRLLLLSATIGNGAELARWLEEIRGVPCHVIESQKRPVPLQFLFLFPDGELAPLHSHRNILPKIRRFLHTQRRPTDFGSRGPLHFGWVIEQLRHWNLLPAIFFLKSRAECDQAIEESVKGRVFFGRDDPPFTDRLHSFLNQYPFLKRHRQLPMLASFRVASHHAGQLPQWKLLIEEMMNQGYLDAIYSTSTVAAGVNFPARTVVLVQSDRFDGRTFSDLTATELHQMTGRAGRRGKDRIGFALVLPGLYQDPVLIHLLIESPPEPVRSQIQMSFSMVLNLLLSHRPSEIRRLLHGSLAAFQERQAHPSIRKESTHLLNTLKKILPEGVIPDGDPMEFLHALQAGAGLRKRVRTLKRDFSKEHRELLFSEYLKRGRLFVHKRGQVYVLFHTFHRNRKMFCSAHQVTSPIKVRKRQIRLRKIPIQAIDHLLDYRVDIPEGLSVETLSSLLASIPINQVNPLRLEPITRSHHDAELRKAEKELGRFHDFRRMLDNVKLDKDGKAYVKKLEELAVRIGQVPDYLWNEFNRHLDFLRDTGFVDRENRLTEDGRWASCLRLDHPLLIAEAIRREIFDGADPPTLTALIAPFVVDKTRDIEISDDGKQEMAPLRREFKKMLRAIDPLLRVKRAMGFETPQLQFWPAACLYLWARDMAWSDLIRRTAIEEGDMAMLVARTTDHLRQFLDLKNTHPNLTRTARKAILMILREPVGLPSSGIPAAVDRS